jgi:hypothetical protein
MKGAYMRRVLQGVIHGRTIELEGDPGVENGSEVEVLLQMKRLTGPRRGWESGLGEVPTTAWTDEDDEIFAEIQTGRRTSIERGIQE